MSDNHFKDNYYKYIKEGYSVIPAKFQSKLPAIKAWADYCYKLPTIEELNSWCNNFDKTNIDVCLGEVSGIIALDLDATDQKVLDLILPILPQSPVEKKGSKGFTRFFRYNGESTQNLKFNGETILEILSYNKKTTIPPSIHPNGLPYTWTSDKTLLDIDKNDLPLLPPYLLSHIESKLKLHIPDATSNGAKGIVSGRNNGLAQLAGKLIMEKKPVDSAIKEFVEYDKREHETPLFTDVNEMPHSEPFTNALQFYINILQTANTKHFRDNKAYEIPVTASAINAQIAKDVDKGKSQALGSEKKLKQESSSAKVVRELPVAKGVLRSIQNNILANSFIPQEEFAFSASLVLISTLICRKMVFQGMSPNLYALNIAPSGAGKDACQQKLKEYLSDIGAQSLLGAGDYVSDAALMDGLDVKPVRLDIMDEVGGILKKINSGNSEYNGKMADILAEMYTSSNSRYLGRAVAGEVKGGCDRPNINILGSTTPTGFQEGVSLRAIEKGLMGRFLVFIGDSNKKAKRVKNFTRLDQATKSKLSYFAAYRPQETENIVIGNIPQMVTEIQASDAANTRLDEIFEEFDTLRVNTEHTSSLLPIIARLYQQMVKIVLIHAASRANMEVPKVDVIDVEFGYETILYYFDTIKDVVNKYIHGNYQEEVVSNFLNIIRAKDFITKSELLRKTRKLKKFERDNMIKDLIESGEISVSLDNINGTTVETFTYIGG